MPDGQMADKLPEGNWSRLQGSLEEYKQRVVHRNFFGPPNNAPSIGTINGGNPRPKNSIRFAIPASDSDGDNKELNYELVASGSPGAEIEVKNGLAVFTSPGLEEGTYKYEVKVTDRGCPPKIDSKTFSFRVEKVKVAEVEEVEEVPDARVTVVSSLTRNVKGEYQVWINFRATQKRELFVVGDVFELDDKEWEIISHDFDKCVIRCGDLLLSYQISSNLSNPVESKKIAEASETTTSAGDSSID